MASRGCGSQPYVPRGPVPPARHYDLAARSSREIGGNAGRGSAAPGPKSPRWSAERRASLPSSEGGRHPQGAWPATHFAGRGCPLHPSGCRRSATPHWGDKQKKRVTSRKRESERRDENEKFFVGWAKAHAEQWMAAPQTRSRAPCPRGALWNAWARRSDGDARAWPAPIAPSKTGRGRPDGPPYRAV